VTRGDGIIGEDVTANVRTIKTIPLRIPVSRKDIPVPDVMVVRGEVFMFNSDFEKLNEELIAKGEKTPKGTIRLYGLGTFSSSGFFFYSTHLYVNISLCFMMGYCARQ
ncbi:MAG: hypothetical protein IKG59_01770, partial [Firmicutes bacterium]|nr:hypothetical protein [Bacillota bacterium]